jgi:hypothetical protein
MHNKFSFIGMLVAAVIMNGCATTPVSVESCPEVDTALAPEKPPEGGKRKVVFLGFSDAQAGTGEAGVAGLIASRTATLVSKSGAEVVDPSLAEGLSEQIRRYEIRGESNYSSSLATDAIKGEIVNAGLTYSFIEKQKIESNEGVSYTPEKCRFKATLSGTLNIYSVNPLQLMESLPISGSSGLTLEMSNKECPLPAGQDEEMFRQAALNAGKVAAFKNGIYDHFRQVGFVREVRMCMEEVKDNYVWLSTSPDQGATPGSDVGIYRQYWYEDKLDGPRLLRRMPVPTGKIVQTTNDSEAWVKIKEREAAKGVMLGDLAEITHADCDKAYAWMCGF